MALVTPTQFLFAAVFDCKLVLTDDQHFDPKWNNTAGGYGPKIHAVRQVYRGQVVHARLFFKNMSLGAQGAGNVSYDIALIDPRGVVQFSQKGMKAMKTKIPDPNAVFLSDSYIVNRFEEKDVPGTYRIQITAYDNIAGAKAYAEETIDLVPYEYRKPSGNLEDISRRFAHYYVSPDPGRIFDFFEIIYAYSGKKGQEDIALTVSPSFRAYFRDNPYLLPPLAAYVNGLEGPKRKQIRAILKAVSIDHPALLSQLNLTDEERAAIDSMQYPDIWDDTFGTAAELDMLWASFFATGDIKPVAQIVKALRLIQEKDPYRSVIGGAAQWSLTSNCTQHGLVRAYCIYLYENDKTQDAFTKQMLGACIAGAEKPSEK
jgi:hypothetical protein